MLIEKHQDYDRYYLVTFLAREAIFATAMPKDDAECDQLWDAYLCNQKPVQLPSAVTSMAAKYRPIAALMDRLFHGLRNESKHTPYPEEALAREWKKL